MAEKGDNDDCSGKRLVFGDRYLTDPGQVFQHNAWDHVEWDPEHLARAREMVANNSSHKLPQHEQLELLTSASENWDSFYGQHQNKFFKDRHWLFTEFPELFASSTGTADSSAVVTHGNNDSTHGTSEEFTTTKTIATNNILEVGCGVGNTVFPILQTTASHQGVFVHCCDFSSTAIELVKKNPLYDPAHCSAFVHDISSDESIPIKDQSIDYIVMIFVLSAISPNKFPKVLKKLCKCLKPGGKLLFRDYGRLDLAQLRFKPGQCLQENFYVRGDKTLVYYFTEDEVNELFTKVGLVKEQLLTDNRLQVNRGKQIKMYRVWIQAKFTKPLNFTPTA